MRTRCCRIRHSELTTTTCWCIPHSRRPSRGVREGFTGDRRRGSMRETTIAEKIMACQRRGNCSGKLSLRDWSIRRGSNEKRLTRSLLSHGVLGCDGSRVRRQQLSSEIFCLQNPQSTHQNGALCKNRSLMDPKNLWEGLNPLSAVQTPCLIP